MNTSTFAERYEAACQFDETLRVLHNSPMAGPVKLHFGEWFGERDWFWSNDHVRFECSVEDAVTYATVAMLKWLPRNVWCIGVAHGPDDTEHGGYRVDFCGTEPRFESPEIHECLLAAVEWLIANRQRKAVSP